MNIKTLTFLWYLNYKVWCQLRKFPIMPFAEWQQKDITCQLLWAEPRDATLLFVPS